MIEAAVENRQRYLDYLKRENITPHELDRSTGRLKPTEPEDIAASGLLHQVGFHFSRSTDRWRIQSTPSKAEIVLLGKVQPVRTETEIARISSDDIQTIVIRKAGYEDCGFHSEGAVASVETVWGLDWLVLECRLRPASPKT